MDLLSFIYLGDINTKLSFLAELTNEKWSSTGRTDNNVLKNYLPYTFQKLYDENKVITTKEYCLFNTGLFTEYYEPIYAYCTHNEAKGSQEWYLDKFCTDYDLGNIGVAERPERANYFQDPSLLILDVNCPINVQYKHILEDSENLKRFPTALQSSPMLCTLFKGAVETMKRKVMANYKLAVPQYFDGKIQLLLPICLEHPDKADIALVVTKNADRGFYQGHTCLTMEMAYMNARLIAKPDSNWLSI